MQMQVLLPGLTNVLKLKVNRLACYETVYRIATSEPTAGCKSRTIGPWISWLPCTNWFLGGSPQIQRSFSLGTCGIA